MRNRSSAEATQLTLFDTPIARGIPTVLASPAALSPDSTLEAARWWYRRHLEANGHPPNTVAAYTNDLSILQSYVANKPIKLIDSEDIGRYLGSARRRSTRKRRLTSAREFYAYLVRDAKVLSHDPTEPFFPERIHLKTPVPLSPLEQERLLGVAREEGARSYLMVYCLLVLGLNRTELLNLRAEHVDVSDPEAPVVYVRYDDPRWRHKERHLRADRRFSAAYAEHEPDLGDGRLFPILPQTVNAIVHRLARGAGIRKLVTPQSLRDTFGVEQARRGRTEDELLAILGLAPDPRNRDSVRRYIRLAEPPKEVAREAHQ